MRRPVTAGPAPVAPVLVKPTGITVRIAGPRRRGVQVTGRLVLPPGTDPRLCAGGRISVGLKPSRGRARTVVATLGPNCRFAATVGLNVKRRARLTARTRFTGTAALTAISGRPLKLRAR